MQKNRRESIQSSVLTFQPYLATSPSISSSLRHLSRSFASVCDSNSQSNRINLSGQCGFDDLSEIGTGTHKYASTNSGNASFGQTVANSVNLLVGIGLLGYGYAFRMCGWLAIPILLCLAASTRYTARILGTIMDYHPECNSFTSIGTKAFGKVGTISISVLFFLEVLVGACASFLLVFADNLQKLFPTYSVTLYCILGTLIVLPTTWLKDLAKLSYLSVVGVLASFVLVFAIVYTGISTRDGIGSLQHVQHTNFVVPETVPFSLGILMVGFGGHAVFPSIYNSMQNKSQYPSVLNVAYILTFLSYGGVATMAYLMYGDQTQQEITLNLPNGWATEACLWMIVLSSVSKFALSIAPVCEVIEGALDATKRFHLPLEDDAGDTIKHDYATADSIWGDIECTPRGSSLRAGQKPASDHKELHEPLLSVENSETFWIEHESDGDPDTIHCGKDMFDHDSIISSHEKLISSGCCSRFNWRLSTKRYWRAVGIRTILTAISLSIAIVVPNFDRIMSFVGALLTFTVSVAFPPAAYVALMSMTNAPLSFWSKFFNWTLCAFGCICAIIGTIAAIIGPF